MGMRHTVEDVATLSKRNCDFMPRNAVQHVHWFVVIFRRACLHNVWGDGSVGTTVAVHAKDNDVSTTGTQSEN